MRTAFRFSFAVLIVAVAASMAAGCGGSGSTSPDVSFVPDNGGETAESNPDSGVDGIEGEDQGATVDPGTGGTDGQVVVPDDGPVDSGSPDVAESPFFPSEDLFLKILGPSAREVVSSAGSLVSVSGILFGKADTIEWSSPKGSGSITPEHFWLSDAIELDPGDNLVTVTARQGARTASDTVRIVYTPGFLFTREPEVKPDTGFVGESVKTQFTIRLGQGATLGENAIKLYSTQADLSPDQVVGTMKDDGDVSSSGDEILSDGVFSFSMNVKCNAEGRMSWRVGISVESGVSSYIAYSQPVTVECMPHLTSTECQAVLDTQKAAKDLWEQKKGTTDLESARAAVLAYLQGVATVDEAGLEAGGNGAWVRYKSGVLGVLSLSPEGIRAGGGEPGAGDDPADDDDGDGLASASSALLGVAEIASKSTYVLSPYASKLGQNDETDQIHQWLKDKACPTYDLVAQEGAQVSLERMRSGMGAGILVLATHGDTFFGGMKAAAYDSYAWGHKGAQETLFLGEAASCSALLTGVKSCYGAGTCPEGTECVITEAAGTSLSGTCVDRTQADLKRGRVAITGDGTFAVLPSFVERYGHGAMPDSLVYLGACRTAYNGTLAAEFLGAGAMAIAAFTGYVSSEFAALKGKEFFHALIEQDKVTGLAFPSTDLEDPANKGSKFVMIGANDLTVTNSVIANEGFERSDLTGWTADGDGRVITRLGVTKPVSGKFMGILSTGLGFTVETGNIEQTFCIPPETYAFSFFWKFYSEEFHEFCGSEFQDTFKARFVDAKGAEYTVVDVAVDDLCNPEDCGGCCDDGKCVGLVESDVQFDKGDTHVVPKWQRAKMKLVDDNNNPIMATGPVTLSFFGTDKGDSIYDTVVLVDGLQFK